MSDDNDSSPLDTAPLVVTNKAGKSFVVDGEAYKLLPNGAVYDMQAGRIAANPGGGTGVITQATSSDMRSKWFERRLQANLAAGRGLAIGSGSPDEMAAVENLTANMAEMAMDKSLGRVAVEAYRAGMAAAGFSGQDTRREDASDRPAVSIQLDQSAVDGLIALVTAWRAADGDE